VPLQSDAYRFLAVADEGPFNLRVFQDLAEFFHDRGA
jgi:hypothetical protein